jgi:hypothetical protein
MCIAAAPNLISDFTVRADVEGARAEARVDVHSSGRSHTSVMRRTSVSDVVEVGDAEVGQPERARGDAAAREVDRA